MKNRIKSLVLFIFISTALSSCYVEYETAPPFVDVIQIDEYEYEEVLYEHWENGHLVYEEVAYHAMMDIDLRNSGAITARNVSLEITLFDRYNQYTTVLPVSNIYPGETITVSFDTGYEFTHHYYDVEIAAFWD